MMTRGFGAGLTGKGRIEPVSCGLINSERGRIRLPRDPGRLSNMTAKSWNGTPQLPPFPLRFHYIQPRIERFQQDGVLAREPAFLVLHGSAVAFQACPGAIIGPESEVQALDGGLIGFTCNL